MFQLEILEFNQKLSDINKLFYKVFPETNNDSDNDLILNEQNQFEESIESKFLKLKHLKNNLLAQYINITKDHSNYLFSN